MTPASGSTAASGTWPWTPAGCCWPWWSPSPASDRDGAHRLLAALRAKFSTIALIWADGGYAGRLVDWAKTVLSFAVTIVKRTDDTAGFQVIPRRWVVERTLAWISKYRRCVRDYETRTDHSEAMVYIAMIMTMSRRLTR